MSTARVDPFRGYNFRVELDNTNVASFRECGGLDRDDGLRRLSRGQRTRRYPCASSPGLRKFANITLKRGYTTNQDLWNWYKNILNGVTDRRNGAIVLQDEQHNDVLRWNFENGWICKWEGPAMNATSNDVAIESIEICHERIELA